MYGTDDACSPVLRVSYDLPFMQRRFTTIYVCTNGLICFNRPFNGYSIPKKQGFNNDFLNIYCLAPYFADLDLTYTGQVWYQAYNTLADDSSQSADISIKVHDLVNELYDEEFYPVYVLKATWYEARYVGGRPSETVTFQVIYATDGQRSYAFYNYAEMNFQSGLQFIGIINNGNFEGLDYSSDESYLRRPDKNLIFG
ncbi:mucin-like protein, partial [Mercenaria mercenaria]|uniref:mucin-like protein n=1 Tax=Mercenaria mercenaria TaxID=6596 RepID=UPI00234EBC12